MPMVGEIRLWPGNFAPAGWAFCNGQLMAISENDALFNLIGTTYGGDGEETFALPNLQSRVPVHQGNSLILGETGGEESVTLTLQQIPNHSHVPLASNTGGVDNPSGSVWANSTAKAYSVAAPNTTMNAAAMSPVGGSQPHDNMLPFLAINFIISLYGVYPSESVGSDEEPFLAEVKLISFNFAPKGWAFCNGQLLPINQNQALFSILGTTYGGNGQTNFALPDLRGRTPVHVGNGIILGERGGETAHTLILSEMPAHTHTPVASASSPTANATTNNLWASNTGFNAYATSSNESMNPAALSPVGGSQAHDNMSPYLVLNFVVALQGIFPSRN